MKKKLLLIFALIMSSQIIFAQNDAISKYFKKYMDDETFTSVYISPKMFKLIGSIADENEEGENDFAEISKDIHSLRILTSSNAPRSLYEEANKTLNLKSFEELMTVREKGQDIKFLTKSEGDKISELLLLISSDQDFTMLNFTGDIDLNKLAKLGDKLDIQGTNHLGKLNKK